MFRDPQQFAGMEDITKDFCILKDKTLGNRLLGKTKYECEKSIKIILAEIR